MRPSVPPQDPFDARAPLGPGLPDIYRLAVLGDRGVDLARAPVTLKILLENVLRHAGRGMVGVEDVEALAAWKPGSAAEGDGTVDDEVRGDEGVDPAWVPAELGHGGPPRGGTGRLRSRNAMPRWRRSPNR